MCVQKNKKDKIIFDLKSVFLNVNTRMFMDGKRHLEDESDYNHFEKQWKWHTNQKLTVCIVNTNEMNRQSTPLADVSKKLPKCHSLASVLNCI